MQGRVGALDLQLEDGGRPPALQTPARGGMTSLYLEAVIPAGFTPQGDNQGARMCADSLETINIVQT